MISLKEAFDFEDGGRAYQCHVEEQERRGCGEAWWWFGVSGDDNRYAPFRADTGDTEVSVRSRVVAYYEDRVSRRGAGWQDRRFTPHTARGAAPPPA